MAKWGQVMNALRFCPICGKGLETHPITGNRACYLHGDFVVQEKPLTAHDVTVEFNLTPWAFKK